MSFTKTVSLDSQDKTGIKPLNNRVPIDEVNIAPYLDSHASHHQSEFGMELDQLAPINLDTLSTDPDLYEDDMPTLEEIFSKPTRIDTSLRRPTIKIVATNGRKTVPIPKTAASIKKRSSVVKSKKAKTTVKAKPPISKKSTKKTAKKRK
jgi:hypothetical protein